MSSDNCNFETNCDGRRILKNPNVILDEDERMKVQNENSQILAEMLEKAVKNGCIDLSNGYVKKCPDSCKCLPICE
jgi:hypothetical protein